MVHSHHVHGNGILGRRGGYHILRSSAQVQLGLVLLREDASRPADAVGASGSPADGSWILLVEDLDAVAIDNEETHCWTNNDRFSCSEPVSRPINLTGPRERCEEAVVLDVAVKNVRRTTSSGAISQVYTIRNRAVCITGDLTGGVSWCTHPDT